MMESQPTTKQARVGVGVFVLNSKNQFLIGERKGSHGSGTYALPGGHLEFGETFEACAARETLEETGLVLTESEVKFLTATNNVFKSVGKGGEAQLHYVTVFMVAVCALGAEPELLEPDKCNGWEWVSWEEAKAWAIVQKEELPARRIDKELFLPLLDLFKHRPGIDPAQAIREQA